MGRRNGKQPSAGEIRAEAIRQAGLIIGKNKSKRIRIVYQCTECQTKLKTSHLMLEENAPEGLTGMLVPCVCTKCLQEQLDGRTPEQT